MWYISCMDQISFKTISIIREVEYGDHVYRFHVDAEGKTFVRRVPIDNRLWSHAVICQRFSVVEKAFIPSTRVSLTASCEFSSFELAVKTILGIHVAVLK